MANGRRMASNHRARSAGGWRSKARAIDGLENRIATIVPSHPADASRGPESMPSKVQANGDYGPGRPPAGGAHCKRWAIDGWRARMGPGVGDGRAGRPGQGPCQAGAPLPDNFCNFSTIALPSPFYRPTAGASRRTHSGHAPPQPGHAYRQTIDGRVKRLTSHPRCCMIHKYPE